MCFVNICIASVVWISIMSACSSSTKLSSDELQKIKNMQPPAGKALIYVLRVNSSTPGLSFDMTSDNIYIGKLGLDRFTYVTLDSGQHTFNGYVHNAKSKETIGLVLTTKYYRYEKAELPLICEPNQIYFLEEQDRKYGAANVLKLMDQNAGKKLLLNHKIKLANDYPAYISRTK